MKKYKLFTAETQRTQSFKIKIKKFKAHRLHEIFTLVRLWRKILFCGLILIPLCVLCGFVVKKFIMNKNCSTINPCYHCMPLGAIFAAKGFEKAAVILHGSQGCATYMRRHLARHFHEPVDVASSSLDEKDAIYGGEKNLEKAIRNTWAQYQPRMIVIAGTCLSETIGDDIESVVKKMASEISIPLIAVSTPSYQGSFSDGYWKTIRAALMSLRVKRNNPVGLKKKSFINLIPGLITPEDLRLLRRLGEIFEIDFHILGDYADTFNAPWESSFKLMPDGGSPIGYLKEAARATATIEFSMLHPEEDSPAILLEQEFEVPAYRIPYPVGLNAVDEFMRLLAEFGKKDIPPDITVIRGKLLDAMADAHKILFGKRAALFGESEYLFSIHKALQEWGMKCPVLVYGERGNSLNDKLNGERIKLISNGSIFELKEWLMHNSADLLLGSSVGASLAAEFELPLLRRGFPIHDRFGAGRILTIGYEGTLSLIDDISNIFAEKVHSSFREKLKKDYLGSLSL